MSGDTTTPIPAEVIEAAARAWFDRGQAQRLDEGRKRPDGRRWQWDDLTESGKIAYRVLVVPVLAAAVPVLLDSERERVWDEGYAVGDPHQRRGDPAKAPNPYRIARTTMEEADRG